MIRKICFSLIMCAISLMAMAQHQVVTHVVQRGETIESIAKQYNVSVADINKANPNAEGVVYVGMKLQIPLSTEKQSANTPDATLTTVNKGKQTKTTDVELSETPVAQTNSTAKAAKSQTGNLEFVGEIGYGFIEGSDNFMYEITAGVNYFFLKNLYAGARIGYNSANYNSMVKVEGQSINSKSGCHLLQIPLELGYAFRYHSFALVPFAGLNANIGLSGKSKIRTYGKNGKTESHKQKTGGKVGIGARAGLRLCLGDFAISGSYQIPMTDEQKKWFGKKAFPEVSILFNGKLW